MIIHDHRRLRELLDQVRVKKSTARARRLAMAELLPLVRAHAGAEEKTLYAFARKTSTHLLRPLPLSGKQELWSSLPKKHIRFGRRKESHFFLH